MGGTALVLGGGGVTGVAWELGLLAGLAEAGIDLSGADRVIGTSAGSVVAAQLTSGTPIERLYESQLAPPTAEVAARLGPRTLLFFLYAALRSRDAQRFGARVGRMALRARTVPPADRKAVIAARLPSHDWPHQTLLITAVDANTGEFVVFDRDAGVPLVDAVGASCAVPGVWPPVTSNGRTYIDGGVRSPANADLAAGADRVVVVAPLVRGGGPTIGVAAQLAKLIAAGAQAVAVSPDEAARRAIGRNVLDPARRAAAARAGRAQAAHIAPTLKDFWTP